MKGPLLIAAASIVWAIGIFLRKIILVDTSSTVLTAYSYVLTSGILLLSKDVRKKSLKAFMENKLMFLALGLFGVVGIWFFLYGLDLNSVTISTIIMRIQPIIAILFAMAFLKEKVSLYKVPWITLSLILVCIVVIDYDKLSLLSFSEESLTFDVIKDVISPQKDISLLGVVCFLFAATSWVISDVIGKKLSNKKIEAEVLTLVRFTLGTIIMIVPSILLIKTNGFNAFYLSSYNIVLTIVSAITSIMLGFTLFYKGLELTSVIVSSFLQLLTPVVSISLGVLFLGEKITFIQVIAALLLFLSVAVISKGE